MGNVTINHEGQAVVMPWDQATGAEIKQQLNLPAGRMLTMTGPDGRTQVVSDTQRVTIPDGVFVSDVPRFEYGGDIEGQGDHASEISWRERLPQLAGVIDFCTQPFRVQILEASAQHQVEIQISEDDYRPLLAHLLQDPCVEQHAFLCCGISRTESCTRLLVREVVYAGGEDFIEQSGARLELNPAYVLGIHDRCLSEGLHVVQVHSHPGVTSPVRFSMTDYHCECQTFPWYEEKYGDRLFPATLVFGHGEGNVDGHWWDRETHTIRAVDCIRVVGNTLTIHPITSARQAQESLIDHARFDRQERAFGHEGQVRIGRLRVGIVGLGGLGSHLAQQLAHLGVTRFVLVDHDRVEPTNLNRLVGARPDDIGKAKVTVMADMVRALSPTAEVAEVIAGVETRDAREALKLCDLLIAGADADGARLVANEIAMRYLIPYLDLGTGLNVADGAIRDAGGQLWFVRPGGFCLQCTGAIDPARARVDLMDPLERARHEERYGTTSPQPSVIHLNAVIASLAVGQVIKYATGWHAPVEMAFYNAVSEQVTPIQGPSRNAACLVCNRTGLYARGDEPETTAFEAAVPLAELTTLTEPPPQPHVSLNMTA